MLQKISKQGNASNIPGLSTPGVVAGVAAGAATAVGGFPSLGSGGASGGMSYPTIGGAPAVGVHNPAAGYPAFSQA